VVNARSLRVSGRLETVAHLAALVREEAEASGLSGNAVLDIELAVAEAANNIVAHGYKGGPGDIELRVVQDGGLRVELTDWGSPIPEGLLENPPIADLGADHGRGLSIIRACVDRVDYTRGDGFNHLTLFKALG
jgi:anti-sigma regulatory factor (Ser/Thr protein kinase)